MFRSEIYFEGSFYDVTWTQSGPLGWHDVIIGHCTNLGTGRQIDPPEGLLKALYERGRKIREASKLSV